MILALTDNDIAPVTEDSVLGAKQLGLDSEVAFQRAAIMRGWSVCAPVGEQPDFDCIIKKASGRPIVVQVKRAALQPNSTTSYNVRCGKMGRRYLNGAWVKRRPYAENAFDVLAAHLPDADQFVFFTRAEIRDRTGLGYTPPAARKTSIQARCVAARDPNNWELLDDVAQSLTNSGGRTANVPDPQ